MEYVKTYFQKMRVNAPVKETIEDFSIYTKDIPFVICGESKELYSNDWKGESGSDEYIPSVIPLKEYDMDVEFAYKGAKNSANTKIKAFLDYITGKDGTGAELKIYNTHTRIGRQHVRFVKLDDDADLERDDSGAGDILTFKITFRVNDPDTDITLSK